jgi:hypothetical protein
MAGLSCVRQHKALRHVGQPHRPAAGHGEGGPDRPLTPQVAAPHQKPDQPTGVQVARRPHPALQQDLGGSDRGRGRRRRGRPEASLSLPRSPPLPLPVLRQRICRQTSLAAAPRLPRGQPEAAATIACVSTTPTLVPRPRSARRAAPTRKTNRPAAGPYSAAAAGPIPTYYPPPSFSVPELATAMYTLPIKNFTKRT